MKCCLVKEVEEVEMVEMVEEVEMVEGGLLCPEPAEGMFLFDLPSFPSPFSLFPCSMNLRKGADPRFLNQRGKTRSEIRLWRDRKHSETKSIICYSYFHINK